MELSVIRHTRLDIASGICYGQSEIALSDSYEQELAALRQQLPGPFCKIYSSPLARCRRLADAFGGTIETDARLLEYDFGDWELCAWNDIDATQLDRWMQDFVNLPTPNGESLLDMQARVDEFLGELRARNHDQCLLVTHAGVIRCIWAHLLRIPLEEIFKLEVGYGDVLRIRLGESPEYDVVRSTLPRD